MGRASWQIAALAAGLTFQAASGGIVVSPLKQEVQVNPGRTESFCVSISYTARSPADRPETVRLQVMDFAVDPDGTLLFRPAGTSPSSASRWITLSRSELTLAPGEGRKVECTVAAPFSASGEYYSCIMVTMGAERKTAPGVGVKYRIASGVFVTVPGRTLPRSARVADCRVAWAPPTTRPDETEAADRADQPGIPWPRVVALVQNTGQARFDASARLQVSTPAGRVVFDSPMVSRRATVQAGDARRFSCPLAKPLGPGQYVMRVEVDCQSRWGKVYQKEVLAVSEEQSAELVRLAAILASGASGPGLAGGLGVLVTPERLSARVPAGGLRALKLDVRNTGQLPAEYRVSLSPGDPCQAPWVSFAPAAFALDSRQSQSVALTVRVPPDASGTWTGTMDIEAAGTDDARTTRQVVVEITAVGGN